MRLSLGYKLLFAKGKNLSLFFLIQMLTIILIFFHASHLYPSKEILFTLIFCTLLGVGGLFQEEAFVCKKIGASFYKVFCLLGLQMILLSSLASFVAVLFYMSAVFWHFLPDPSKLMMVYVVLFIEAMSICTALGYSFWIFMKKEPIS